MRVRVSWRREQATRFSAEDLYAPRNETPCAPLRRPPGSTRRLRRPRRAADRSKPQRARRHQRSIRARPPRVSRQRRIERARLRQPRRADRRRVRRGAVPPPRLQTGRHRRQLRADGGNDAPHGDRQTVDRDRQRGEVDLRQGVRGRIPQRAVSLGAALPSAGFGSFGAARIGRVHGRGEPGLAGPGGAGGTARDPGAPESDADAVGSTIGADAHLRARHHRRPGRLPPDVDLAVGGRGHCAGGGARRHRRADRNTGRRSAEDLHLQRRRHSPWHVAVRRSDPDYLASRSFGSGRQRPRRGQDLQRCRR